jgi:stage V sporulation protein S
VRSTSDVQGLASAIAHAIYEGRRPVMRAIGASAVNQAVKATCIARGYAAQCGYDLCFRTGFENIYLEREQKELSAIRIEVLPRA